MLTRVQLKTRDYLVGDTALRIGETYILFLANRSLASWSDHPFTRTKVKIISVRALPSFSSDAHPGWMYDYTEIENENN